MSDLLKILNDAVEKFSSREYLEEMLKAKKEYFELVGKISDEDDDFESRMNAFNYWYISQRNAEEKGSLLNTYLEKNQIVEEKAKILKELNHSLFEYRGLSFTKKHVFYDILHDIKFSISDKEFNFQLIKDDIFTARSIVDNGSNVLLDDISILPSEIRPILVKECKKVRKLKDKKRDLQFLMKVENLKTKWKRYGHLDAKKIFKFDF